MELVSLVEKDGEETEWHSLGSSLNRINILSTSPPTTYVILGWIE